MVSLRYYTKTGKRITDVVDCVEKAILDYRRDKRSRYIGAQNGEYSIDGGATWLRL